MADEKSKGGAPSKYDPAYCDKVIEWGKAGKSIEWMCAELGVVYNTLASNWPAAFPEFADALALSQLHALRWWEDQGQDSMAKRDFNANLYSRSMAARFPKKWRESKQTEVTLPPGEGEAADLSGLSEEELRLLARIRVRKGAEPTIQ